MSGYTPYNPNDPQYAGAAYQQLPPQQYQPAYQPAYQPQQSYQPVYQQPAYQPAYQPPVQQQYQPSPHVYDQPHAKQPAKHHHEAPPEQPLVAYQGEKFVEAGAFRDVVWLGLWVLQLVAILVLCIVLFGKYRSSMDADDNSSDSNATIRINAKFWSMIAIDILAGAAMCAFMLWLVKTYARTFIWFTLIMSVVILVFLGILFAAAGEVVGAVIMFIFAALNLLYMYLVRRRIEFSAVVLEICSKVIQMYPAPIYVAFGSIFVQAVWMIVWVLAAASTLYALDHSTVSNGARGFVYFLLLVSFFWTSQVIKNVVHVTAAGVLATWYFQAPHDMPPNPTTKSLKRATTTSLGSICLGSLIIAVIKALRTMAQQARRSENNFVRCCVECLLQCLENMVEYFNLYAFTQIAIYGKSYCDAAKDTWQLLKARGVDMIINDDLIGGVLAWGSLIGGALVAAVGVIFARYIYNVHNWGLLTLIAFLIGFAMLICAMEIIESYVAALFVCYAEDPATLHDTKRVEYDMLNNAVQQWYPRQRQ